MKIYTEEDIAKAVMFGRWGGTMKEDYEEFLNKLTPIELPTDEEIDEESPYVPNDASIDFWSHKEGFVEGAKWMRDKIPSSSINNKINHDN